MKRIILCLVLLGALIPYGAQAATTTVDCDWGMTCSGDTLVRAANCTVDSNIYNFSENVPCPHGCIDNGGQYGAKCDGDENECTTVTLQFMSFGSQFAIGLGSMLMFVGAGLIVDTLIRRQDKKEKDFYGEPGG